MYIKLCDYQSIMKKKTHILTRPTNHVCKHHVVIKFKKNRYKSGFTVIKDSLHSRVKKV